MLGLASDAFAGPFTVYSALVDSDVVFAPAEPDDGGAGRGHAGVDRRPAREPDRALRRSAWESYADGYLGARNTLAANLAGAVKQAVFSRAGAAIRLVARSVALPLERPARDLRQPDRGLRGEPADLAPVLAAATVDPRCRAACAVRRGRATRGRLARVRVRAVRRVDLRVARATRRRVRRDGQARLPRGALGGRLPDGRQDGRCILRRGARDGPVHHDELRRDRREPRDARSRARPLDALVSDVAVPAAGLHPLLAVRRRGGVELPPGAAACPPRRHRRRSRRPARRARGGDAELPPLLLRHADARALRARGARAGRGAAKG